MKPKNSKSLEAQPKRSKEVWGLTGGIASGKSTAAQFFIQAGIPVIDADQIARELSEKGGAAHDLIVAKFGSADRAQLRNLVFSDPNARQDLEAILHPLIQAESQLRIEKLDKSLVIYEAALLVETARDRELDGLIVVHAPRDLRKARLMARNGFSANVADQMIDAQISEEKRLKAATVVFENAGSLEDLHQKVTEFIEKIF